MAQVPRQPRPSPRPARLPMFPLFAERPRVSLCLLPLRVIILRVETMLHSSVKPQQPAFYQNINCDDREIKCSSEECVVYQALCFVLGFQ